MENTVLLGLGVTVATFFFRYAVPAMPKLIAWAGAIAGVVLMASGLLPPIYRPPLLSAVLFVAGALFIGGAIHVYLLNAPKAAGEMAAGPPAPNTTTAPKTTNTIGDITGNSGIITQGQKGDNVR